MKILKKPAAAAACVSEDFSVQKRANERICSPAAILPMTQEKKREL
jgi:hypothetical protein